MYHHQQPASWLPTTTTTIIEGHAIGVPAVETRQWVLPIAGGCRTAAVRRAGLRDSFLAASQPATPASQTSQFPRRQQLSHESMRRCSIQINSLEVTTRSAHDPDTMLVQWFRLCAAHNVQQSCTTINRCLNLFYSLMDRRAAHHCQQVSRVRGHRIVCDSSGSRVQVCFVAVLLMLGGQHGDGGHPIHVPRLTPGMPPLLAILCGCGGGAKCNVLDRPGVLKRS